MNRRYKTVNTFSRTINCNQIIAIIIVTALFIVYFATVQAHIQDNNNKICLTTFICLAFSILTISTLVSCFIDPVDKIIPIFLSQQRSTLGKQLEKCLYCQSCQSYVFETSRHCKICNRCVQGFDHHCIWINNCIGKNNYRWFFVMICSATIYLIIFITSVGILWKEGQWRYFLSSMIINWFFMLPAIAFALPLTVLIILHCFLISQGLTTYDFIVNKRDKQKKKNENNTQDNLKNNTQNSHNCTQFGGMSLNNKVGVQVDEVIFQPNFQINELQQGSSFQSDHIEKTFEIDEGSKRNEKSEDKAEDNSQFKTIVLESKLDLKQFYLNHKSLKLLVGNSIAVQPRQLNRSRTSKNRKKVQNKIIKIDQSSKIDETN